MNINDSIAGSLFFPPVSTAPQPVQQPTPANGTTARAQESYPQAVLLSTRAARDGALARAELLTQRNVSDESLSSRSRMAIASYRSLEESEERDMISALMGVDEYA